MNATTASSQAPETGDERTARKAASRRQRRRHLIMPFLAAIGAIAVWQLIITGFGVPIYLVPGPVDVWRSLVTNYEGLLRNLWPTAIESVLGFVLGNLIAILIAVVFVHNKLMERTFYPIAVVIRTIPIVAVAPVLVLMFGTGLTPKIVIAALICFFPTLVNMVRGLESVPQQELELMRVLSASRGEIFWKVRMYASLPYLFAALKIAAPNAVIGAIVAEWIGASEGLGALIIQATFNFNAPLLYATMVVASVFSLIFFWLMGFAERLIVTWQPEEQA